MDEPIIFRSMITKNNSLNALTFRRKIGHALVKERQRSQQQMESLLVFSVDLLVWTVMLRLLVHHE